MKQLEHINILPFYGISAAVADFCLVSPWYENGTITDYLKKKPNASRLALVSVFEQVRYRHLPDTYLRPRIVSRCNKRIALPPRKGGGSRHLETSM